MGYHEDTKGMKEEGLVVSHAVIGAAIEVHRQLGPGLLECIYESALCRELWLRRIAAERQVPVQVGYKGACLDGSIRLDVLVERSGVVEVKAVAHLLGVHRAQVLTYLKLTNYQVGLLINFNVQVLRNGIKRIRYG